MIQITNTKLRVLQSFKYLLWLLLLISIFKNISYPLMWADESMTAMGSERVLSYGYPKINDGKNTLYDLLHPNKRLGANEKMDAYIGGAGWLQYYYGTIGCSIANKFSDIYVKTGILRSSFAIVGVFGLFILMQFLSKLIKDKVTSEVFKIAFLVLTISSISLILLIKEVRYFALVFLIFNSILACYFMFRFNERYNEKLFIALMAILHPLCIITFSPIYFILLASIGCIEVILFISNSIKTNIKEAFKDAKPIIMAAILSLVIAIPLIIFFKIFEINEAMSQYNGYNSQMYWNNLKTALNYFTKFEYLWLAIIVKVPTLLFSKKTYTNNKAIFQTSLSLTLLFIIYILAISRMHGVLYTRYIIYLQPIMSISILFDMILLTNLIQSSQLKFKKVINIFVIFAAILLTVNKIYENKEHIAGHIYEMTHKYEGPLDMMIPYIKENFTKPQNLIIATNYEETSFMYYLKAKVIIGYVQNNLTEDLKFKPDIISYRPSWGDRNGIFIDYIKGNDYFVKRFPINNTPTNMISEFNYLPNFTHKFKIEKSYDYQQSVQLWIHNKFDKDRQ